MIGHSPGATPTVAEAAWVQVASDIGMLTGLTRFEARLRDGPQFHVCAELSKLTRLAHLDVATAGRIADAVLLSSLTSLTSLGLSCSSGLTELGVVALAGSLTSLQELRLRCESLQGWAFLQAVAKLTGLRKLFLGVAPAAQSQFVAPALQQLEPLSQLTFLGVPLGSCSDEAQQNFLGRMPGLSVANDCS